MEMDIKTKAVGATITDTSASADEFPGTFLVELSNEALDRDGETLKSDEWETPLPEQITFVNDHTHKMKSVVGSAKPELVDGKILCRGTWAETQDAQDTRKVIKHVPYTSVAFREKRDRKAGTVSRELINGSFVVVPSNPTAKVLASKGFVDGETEELEPLVKAIARDAATEVMKEMTKGSNTFEVKMSDPNDHGLQFLVDEKSSTVQVKQHGNLLGEHKFSLTPEGAHDDSSDSAAADEVKEKAAAQALAAANQIVSRMESEQE
jgi:hypothetical protein